MKYTACVTVVTILSLAGLASAQLSAQRRAAFEAAPKLETSVSGVHAFTTPPKDFDPLTATNQELWQYGLPEPPDKIADPKGYAIWERAMLALRFHATDVHQSNFSHRPAEIVGKAQTVSNGPSPNSSPNWSGMVSTNTNKVWNSKTSFDKVESVWNVPAAQPPFSAPNKDGPIWSVSNWNGIDGFGTDTLVQGGTNSIYQSAVGSTYVGWVEWWPSYAEIVIDCSKTTACPVYPGDDFFTITYGAAGTVEQYVYDEDLTTGWYGTFGMTFQSGVGVLGASAEYITERPCCVTVSGKNYYYPLANYIYDFFDYSFAYDGAGTLFYPGSTSTHTYLVTMTADDGVTDISYPTAGTSGYQGKYSIWFADENCAYTKGCAY